jgi:uncharacterized membrane protein
VIIFALIALVVAIIAIMRASQARTAVHLLEEDVARLRRRLNQQAGPQAAPTDSPAGPPEFQKVTPPPLPPDMPAKETVKTRRSMAEVRRDFETLLTINWLVWVGGVALALGGIFLVKYSMDQNLLSPALRICLGLLLALTLATGGEYVRRRPWSGRFNLSQPDYVPAALSAAGLFVGFASIYAGFALYGLYSAVVAFVALALVAVLAIAFSLLQGPFIAALGLVGGYLVPALVSSGDSNALALFPYVFVITGAGLGVIRYRAWGWLLWLTLLGGVGWAFFWLLMAYEAGDGPIIGIYLVATAVLLTYVRPRLAEPELPQGPFPALALPMPERAVLAGYGAIAAAAFALVSTDGYRLASIIPFSLLAAGTIYTARREQIFADLPRLMGLLAALLMTGSQLPRATGNAAPDALPWMTPLLPPGLTDVVMVAVLFGAIFAIGGFVALRGARYPGHWAGLSASVPLSILAILHGRLNDFGLALNWALISFALAGLCLAAVLFLDRKRQERELDGAIGAYAVGCIAFLSLGLGMALKDAWLTAALALQVPGIAWVSSKLDVPALKKTAGIAAAVVMARLLANPWIFSYGLADPLPGVNWLIYGYGIPAIGFYWAARRFRRQSAPRLAALLEAGALGFAMAFLTLEIRHLLAPDGRMDHVYHRLGEVSLVSLTWLAVGYGLLRRDDGASGPIIGRGWRVIACIGAANVVLGHFLIANPLWTKGPVGPLPLLDLLLLAYAAPGCLALFYLRAFLRRGLDRLAELAGVASLVLLFTWISLEVRRLFQGEVLSLARETGDAEWYSYSVAWLLYGAMLLALGIWRGAKALRYGALAIILIAVAKVFLFDMSALTGIFRVLSFLGLGLALVAIGFCFQRFVPRTVD